LNNVCDAACKTFGTPDIKRSESLKQKFALVLVRSSDNNVNASKVTCAAIKQLIERERFNFKDVVQTKPAFDFICIQNNFSKRWRFFSFNLVLFMEDNYC
jgi:hypothetical protein